VRAFKQILQLFEQQSNIRRQRLNDLNFEEMKIPPRRPCTLLLALLFATQVGTVHADHVDNVIAAEMKARGIPGIALAVIDGGAIVREQGYGYSDKARKAPVTPSTLFQAASISKPVAAMGALHLVEQGKVSLDEDVNSKLRSWHIPQNNSTREHSVTLRLILSHSAGLTVHGFSGYARVAPIPSLLQILNGQRPANSAPIRVDTVPGSEWRYSGGGYVVMQQLVTDLTWEPFSSYMEKTVLKPLEMRSSTFLQVLPDALAGRVATGYTGPSHTAVKGRWRIHPELAAAGLWTTAGDLARFAIGVQRSLAGTSNPVISQSMTREMLTRQSDGSGLGFFLGGNPLKFDHNGDNRGFNSIIVAFAEIGQGAAILMNANTDIEDLENILVEAIGEQYHWPGYTTVAPAHSPASLNQ
jgi:CubicO group peptidase (beta-lactamase class C family)